MASAGGVAPKKNISGDDRENLPTWEQIQSRAYQIYMERGGVDGNALEDWIQAERELQEQHVSLGEETPPSRKTK